MSTRIYLDSDDHFDVKDFILEVAEELDIDEPYAFFSEAVSGQAIAVNTSRVIGLAAMEDSE